MSVYLAKLYKFSVEAGVDHDVAEAAAPPPPASEALAVELQRLVPGPRHGPVLSLNNAELRLVRRSCTITEKAPTRAFSFTFKTLLRYYA